MLSVRHSYVLSHLQGVKSSTTTINIQNTQAEACSNVKDDYEHVGLSVGGAGGGGGLHIFIGSKMASYSMSFIWLVTKQCTSSFKCAFMYSLMFV